MKRDRAQTAAIRTKAHLLILEARFYGDICDELAKGAIAAIERAGATWERHAVPGALEIPGAIVAAAKAKRFDGFVALGCVLRGETSHYDIVCNNANHWMMHVATEQHIPVGNGILTVDTHAQALARARGGREGKGGDAARACLRLIELAQTFQAQKA